MTENLAAPPGAPSPDITAVVAFWRAAGPERWFAKDEAFDAAFRDGFLALHMEVAARRHDGWIASAEGALALLLLTDQFPRNCFRNTAQMYATDPLARHYARQAHAAGHPEQLEPALRVFFSLPFLHAEDLADQELAFAQYQKLGPDLLQYAIGHRDIIRRFGRFPHRNALLGRASTAEERAFLAEGGFAG